jgi:hypothetical protein
MTQGGSTIHEEPRTNHAIDIVEVPFYGDSIEAARDTQDGSFYVSIRPVCENLGIDFSSQLQKLKGYHWARVAVFPTHDQLGRPQELAFLPLAQVPAWLTHVNPDKIGAGPKLVEKLMRYRVEAVDVLYRHFVGPQPGSRDPILAMIEACRAQRQAQLTLERKVDAIQQQVGNRHVSPRMGRRRAASRQHRGGARSRWRASSWSSRRRRSATRAASRGGPSRRPAPRAGSWPGASTGPPAAASEVRDDARAAPAPGRPGEERRPPRDGGTVSRGTRRVGPGGRVHGRRGCRHCPIPGDGRRGG